ncbi:cathelicidin-7-like isoform X2 [Camelus bactrianus]|uniref:Cathelicidin-7-like isoform X2 n=1 Tax=Camelus bactrianus TaxID=9837 RepID=A0AC58NTF4_CAMBA
MGLIFLIKWAVRAGGYFQGYSLTKRPLGQHPDCDTRLHRSPSLLPFRRDEDPDAPKPVSFTVKETVCPKRTQLPPEQCDFKENGVVKQCLGTVNLYQLRDNNFDITCNELQSVGLFGPILGIVRAGVKLVLDKFGK